MTGSNHSKFRLLIGWCCLMSAALLIMTVFLVTSFNKQLNTNTTEHKESKPTESVSPHNEHLIGLLFTKAIIFTRKSSGKIPPPGQSFRNYMRLIREDESWICHPSCQNSLLSQHNNTVEITVSGLYYINAQIYFQKFIQANDQSRQEMNKRTVTLVRNAGNGKQDKKLSEVIRYEEGSVSLSRIVHLMEKDSISLNIQPLSMHLIKEDSQTYWEIILLYNQ